MLRHIFFRSALIAAPLLWLAGCAPQKPVVQEVRVEVPVHVPEVLPTDAAARELLAYHARLKRMSAGELAVEVRVRDEAAPASATKLALALMTSHGSGELARAQALLDQVLRDTRPEAAMWQGLARLLADSLTEQRRLEDLADRATQQQRDLQRKLDAANEKLEALKAIERSLAAPRNPQEERR
jgi:hypothetical protein